MDGSGSPTAHCAVLHCERAPVHKVPLAPDTPGAEVCAEHLSAMSDGRWVHHPARGGIVLGGEQPLLVDGTAMQVDRAFSPVIGVFSSLTVDGRRLGSGEPQTVEIVLTDDLVRQLSKLVWMFNRTR